MEILSLWQREELNHSQEARSDHDQARFWTCIPRVILPIILQMVYCFFTHIIIQYSIVLKSCFMLPYSILVLLRFLTLIRVTWVSLEFFSIYTSFVYIYLFYTHTMHSTLLSSFNMLIMVVIFETRCYSY